MRRLRRLLARARRYKWHRAAARLSEDLSCALDECRCQLDTAHRTRCNPLYLRSTLHPSRRSTGTLWPSLRSFGRCISISTRTRSPSPQRASRWNMSRWENLRFYSIGGVYDHRPPNRIVARVPRPASRHRDIVHPHLRDEQLCEGAGSTAVRSALSACRLYDGFTLILRALWTYDKESAYVALEEWLWRPLSSEAMYGGQRNLRTRLRQAVGHAATTREHLIIFPYFLGPKERRYHDQVPLSER